MVDSAGQAVELVRTNEREQNNLEEVAAAVVAKKFNLLQDLEQVAM